MAPSQNLISRIDFEPSSIHLPRNLYLSNASAKVAMPRVKGLIKSEEIKEMIPFWAPPSRIGSDVPFHKDIDGFVIKYRSKADRIREVLPDMFTIDENPVVTLLVIKYGKSPIGAYNESILFVEVEWNGQIYDYNFLLHVDNEDSIFSGREMFGFPKVMATFDINMDADTRSGFYHAAVHRPASVTIVEVLFKAIREVKDPWANFKANLGLTIRLMPTPCGINGGKPTVRQVVEVGMKLEGGEVWDGVGSISYPVTSEFDPFYKFPVVEYLSSQMLRHVTARMDPLPVYHDF